MIEWGRRSYIVAKFVVFGTAPFGDVIRLCQSALTYEMIKRFFVCIAKLIVGDTTPRLFCSPTTTNLQTIDESHDQTHSNVNQHSHTK